MGEALFIFADHEAELNTSTFRVLIPARSLELTGHTIRISHHTNIDWTDVPEVVLIERVITTETISKLRLAGARRIVATFDDHYRQLPPSLSSHDYWRAHGGQRMIEDFHRALGLVDLVIVPSPVLAQDYKNACRSIEVVHNYHDPELWGGKKPVNDKIVIGWGGSGGHAETWRQTELGKALKQVAKNGNVEIHTHGPAAEVALNALEVPHTNFPWANLETWCAYVTGFDVGLAPLAGEYDRRRSNIRAVEYGLGRVPFVGSHLEPHIGCPGGIRVTKDREKYWIECLNSLLYREEERKMLAEAGWEWAQEFVAPRCTHVYERVLWPEK